MAELHNAEKKYLECFAKELLEHLYPKRYSNIQCSDRPDLLMGNHYGIEVTWAMFDNQGQANGILEHVTGQAIEKIDTRYIQTMARIQTEFITTSDGIIHGYYPRESGNYVKYQELINAYKKKKAKRHQYHTKETDLFIYPPQAQIDNWLGEELIRGFFGSIREDNPFNNIVIYEEPTLYLYSVLENKIQSVRGSREIIQQCKIEADRYSGWSKFGRIIKGDKP